MGDSECCVWVQTPTFFICCPCTKLFREQSKPLTSSSRSQWSSLAITVSLLAPEGGWGQEKYYASSRLVQQRDPDQDCSWQQQGPLKIQHILCLPSPSLSLHTPAALCFWNLHCLPFGRAHWSVPHQQISPASGGAIWKDTSTPNLPLAWQIGGLESCVSL